MISTPESDVSSRHHALNTRAVRWAGYGLVLAATLWAAWSTLDRYFIGDDFAYVGRFLALPFSDWPSLFVREWSGGLWGYSLPELRPFAALTFMLDSRIWGVNPVGYHLTNAVLHACAAVLVVSLVRRLGPSDRWLSIAAGLLFAVHPAHAEPIAWITGRVDLLATVFYLAGFAAAMNFLQTGRRWALAASCAAYFAGVFSKEFCLTLPLLIAVWAMVYRPIHPLAWRRLALVLAGHLIVVAVYALCRHVAFGGMVGASRSTDFLSADFLGRQIDYLAWMIPPLYPVVAAHRPFFLAHAEFIVGGTATLLLAAFAGWRWLQPERQFGQKALLYFGVIWYWAATLPLVVVTYFSPRHLYLASAGACIALPLVVAQLFRQRAVAASLLALAVAACAVRYHEAVKPWRHAAKVSERLAQAVGAARRSSQPQTVLLLDAPSVYEGAWMWAWSNPFALQPPFLAESTGPLVLEPPDTFVSEARWKDRTAIFSGLAAARTGIVLSVNQRGEIVQRLIGAAQLSSARSRFLNDLNTTSPSLAWARFMEALQP